MRCAVRGVRCAACAGAGALHCALAFAGEGGRYCKATVPTREPTDRRRGGGGARVGSGLASLSSLCRLAAFVVGGRRRLLDMRSPELMEKRTRKRVHAARKRVLLCRCASGDRQNDVR